MRGSMRSQRIVRLEEAEQSAVDRCARMMSN
jgi:hypothetical protein